MGSLEAKLKMMEQKSDEIQFLREMRNNENNSLKNASKNANKPIEDLSIHDIEQTIKPDATDNAKGNKVVPLPTTVKIKNPENALKPVRMTSIVQNVSYDKPKTKNGKFRFKFSQPNTIK